MRIQSSFSSLHFPLFIFLLLSPTLLFAQVQKGKVKTAGKPGAPGKAISGAVISFYDKINATTSSQDGAFQFIAKSGSYSLKSVSTPDDAYVMADNDQLGRKNSVSSDNAVTVSMISKAELTRLKRDIERKTSRKLQDKYDKLYAELETEKESAKMKEDEYNKKIEELDKKRQSEEDLIRQLAEVYARADYDQMDSLSQRINDCIANGELEEAQRLIDSKGSLEEREEKLSSMKTTANLLNTAIDRETKDLAVTYFQKYSILVQKTELDSALILLEKRAALDTTNIEYQKDVTEFINTRSGTGNYLASQKAMKYAQRALRLTLARDGEQSLAVAECYKLILDSDQDKTVTKKIDETGAFWTETEIRNKDMHHNLYKKILDIKTALNADSVHDYTNVMEFSPLSERIALKDKCFSRLPKNDWRGRVRVLIFVADSCETKDKLKTLNSALKLFHTNMPDDSKITERQDYNLLDKIYIKLYYCYNEECNDSLNEYLYRNKEMALSEMYIKKDSTIEIYSSYYKSLANLCFKLKKYNEGLGYSLKLLDKYKEEDKDALNNQAEACRYVVAFYSYIGEFDKAEDYYRQGMYLINNIPGYKSYKEAEYTYAFMLYRKGEYEKAIQVCNAIEHNYEHYTIKNDISLNLETSILKEMCKKQLK